MSIWILRNTPRPGSNSGCEWKGLAVSCGPRGLPTAHNVLYHNNRDGTFTDVSESAGILAPGGRYGLGVAVADFDNDGWPDIYVACDQTPSLLYHNKHDGTFEERGDAMPAWPITPTARCNPAWASRSPISTAMVFSIS